ncbi:hypothetical protein FE257_010497 [Aspergillus nanangensis]|uniref:Uncharacterized protein n=1 Tax=Aspergillus nanangensis TaxID=2582783 RepID=A0AAD4CIX7_ASPNN|nr:hypothetical protein FE257_010497 [Aspergillus nanangensis]
MSANDPSGNDILHTFPRRTFNGSSCPEVSSQPLLRINVPAPASIFERDVQEDIQSEQTSPSIPSHIRTDNYIPPVLEASSAAITDDYDPSLVEIVTHNVHQLAAKCIPGTAIAGDSLHGSFVEDGKPHLGESDNPPPTYALPEPTDIRRLSFISFADVVNSEHAQSNHCRLYALQCLHMNLRLKYINDGSDAEEDTYKVQ